jgi:methanogenic corrinoid protein MtbC1
LSFLLIIATQEQKNVIEALTGEKLREGVKIIVVGRAISEHFAEGYWRCWL